MKRLRFPMPALAFACLFVFTAASAQDQKAANVLYMDFPIPDMSSFSLMGVGPNRVARPAGAKEFSADLLGIAQAGGKENSPAIALEWAPFQTFDRNYVGDSRDKAYDRYKRSFFRRNVQLSLAAVDDSTAARIAVGLSFVLYDHSDPSRDPAFAKGILAAAQASQEGPSAITSLQVQGTLIRDFQHNVLNPAFQRLGLHIISDTVLYRLFNFEAGRLSKDSISAEIGRKFAARLGYTRRSGHPKEKDVDRLILDYYPVLNEIIALKHKDQQAFARLMDEERERYIRARWNAGVLKMGLGNIWYSPGFTWSHLQHNKFSAFLSWGFPFWRWGQGILHTQYIYTYTGEVRDQSSWLIGGRIIAGSNRVHGTVEGAFQTNAVVRYLSGRVPDDASSVRATAGIELRLYDGLWIELAAGVHGPYYDFSRYDDILIFGNVKYTFKQSHRFSIR
jgi:hypothetical protein